MNSNTPDMKQAYKEKFDYINANYTTEADREAMGDFLLGRYKEMNAEADDLLRQTEKAKELH